MDWKNIPGIRGLFGLADKKQPLPSKEDLHARYIQDVKDMIGDPSCDDKVGYVVLSDVEISGLGYIRLDVFDADGHQDRDNTIKLQENVAQTLRTNERTKHYWNSRATSSLRYADMGYGWEYELDGSAFMAPEVGQKAAAQSETRVGRVVRVKVLNWADQNGYRVIEADVTNDGYTFKPEEDFGLGNANANDGGGHYE